MKNSTSYNLISLIGFFLLLFVTENVSAQMGGGGFGGRGGAGGHQRGNRSEQSGARTERVNKSTSGPHGGEVKEVGKVKVEMVFDALMKDNPILFYFMGKKDKNYDSTQIKGNVVVTSMEDNLAISQKLIPTTDGGFGAQLENKTKPFRCKVSFTFEGKEYTEEFSNRGFIIK